MFLAEHNDNEERKKERNEEERRRIEEEVLVTKFSYQKNMKRKIFTSVYMFGNKVSLYVESEIWEKFKELARRELISASKLSEIAVAEYVKNHREPNPQLSLSPYILSDAPSPVRVLCWGNLAGVTNEGKVYCRLGGGAWIQGIACYSCKHNELRKTDEE